MNDKNMRDRLVALEQRIDSRQIRRRVLRRLQHRDGTAGNRADLFRALAVSAVDQQQKLAVARNEGRQHRFDRKGAGALHRHRHEVVAAVGDCRQTSQNGLIDLDEGGVARAPIVNHRLFD